MCIRDRDTAVVMLKFDNGIIATIDNSRKAVYGYDQRVEVFGSEGCVRNENDVPNTVVLSDAERTSCENTYKVMWDRYTCLLYTSCSSDLQQHWPLIG